MVGSNTIAKGSQWGPLPILQVYSGTTTHTIGSQWGPLPMLKVDSGDHYPYYR